MGTVDLIWSSISFILTILIFSYLLGDNPLFRIASYLFVGVSAGVVAVMVIYQVILPRLLLPLTEGSAGEVSMAAIPLVLSVLLFFKLFPRLSGVANFSMAYLVGVGAGVTIGGAVLGTLFGQISASINLFDIQARSAHDISPMITILESVFILVGTISSLVYFHFSAQPKSEKRPQRFIVIEGVSIAGQVFIALTLGAIFAGVYTAAITTLVERLDYIINITINYLL